MDICARAGIPASFYATHQSDILREIERDSRFELGIHPNFLPQSSHGITHIDVLKSCLDFAPAATSMRTHCLYQSSPMFMTVMDKCPQIKVDASLYLPGHPNLQPVDFHILRTHKIRRVPYFWEDDGFAETPNADWSEPPISTPGLNVYAFHPVHVALNTASLSNYGALKRSTPLSRATPADIEGFINRGPGTRTYLKELVETGIEEPFTTITDLAGL